MKENLNIGLIQPVINPDMCWNCSDIFVETEKANGKPTPFRLNIDLFSGERVWQEIVEGIRNMIKSNSKPDIILIPELHLPVSKIPEIKRISRKYNIMFISGIDFQRNPMYFNKIRNRGLITIPNNWSTGIQSSRVTTLYYGKTYFTYMERGMFQNIEGSLCLEDPEKNMYIFNSQQFGNFGIMICSDVFDIERMMLYQARIHHLFIISLNKDLNTYQSMAETLTRLLYCNVSICNTGHFGGSVVMSPFVDPNNRIIYKYVGQKMFNSHILSLPVSDLDKAQKENPVVENKKRLFKASPPGYYDKIQIINK